MVFLEGKLLNGVVGGLIEVEEVEEEEEEEEESITLC